MAYDYRPTAARAATTDPTVPAQRPRPKFQTPTATPSPAATPDPTATPPPTAMPVPVITVAAVIEEFIDTAGVGRAVRRSLRDHVAPELGGMRIDDVNRRDVQALIDGLEADGMVLSQIRSVATALRMLYAHAIAEGYMARNPADAVLLPEERGDYQPIALLPERILSLVLRIVLLLFVLFALVTIAGSA